MQQVTVMIKRHKVLLLLTAVLLVSQFVLPATESTSLQGYGVFAINLSLLLPIAYLLIFGKRYNHKKAFIHTALYAVPVFALVVSLLFILRPETADWLAQEDFIIEQLTALFAAIGSIIIVVVSLHFLGRKQVLPTAAALLIALAFFVISMEEISWGQRILTVESSEFFSKNNMQQETNLHNLNTVMTMRIFYFLVFIIFAVIPFWSKQTEILLKKLSLAHLKVFIPSRWLILIFAISLGFVSSGSAFRIDYAIILVITLIILVASLVTKINGLSQYRGATVLTLTTILFSYAVSLLLNYDALDIRGWSPSEYREFFICLGVMIYSFDLFIRIKKVR